MRVSADILVVTIALLAVVGGVFADDYGREVADFIARELIVVDRVTSEPLGMDVENPEPIHEGQWVLWSLARLFEVSLKSTDRDTQAPINQLVSHLSSIVYEMVEKEGINSRLGLSEGTKDIIRDAIWEDYSLRRPTPVFKRFIEKQNSVISGILWSYFAKQPFSQFYPCSDLRQEQWIEAWSNEWIKIKPRLFAFFKSTSLFREGISSICLLLRESE